MIHRRAASSADRMDDRFCERCGNLADPQTTLTRTGLTSCQACGIHACQQCWARSAGWCPGCGVSIAAAPLLRYLPNERQRAAGSASATVAAPPAPPAPASAAAPPGNRSAGGRLPAIAAAGGALLVTAVVFAFVFAVPLGPTGGVAGATGTPGASVLDTVGAGSPVVSPGAIGSDPTATNRARTGSGGTTGSGTTTPTEPGGGGPPPQVTPDPTGSTPGPTPTPDPTAAPTPHPTPKPTPEPTAPPTPVAAGCVVPTLVGQHRSDARRLWIEAGFTGVVTALAGQGNYVIATQDRTAGATYPCDTGITIGP